MLSRLSAFFVSFRLHTASALATICLAFVLGDGAAQAQTALTWTGASNASNWNSSNFFGTTNWNANNTPATSGTYSLRFNNNTRATNVNNVGGLVLTNMSFGSGAGAFTISGSAVTLRGIISNSSASNQSISFNIALGTSGTFQAASSGTVTLSGAISGTNGFIKTGTGVFRITGANTYSGATQVNAGSISIDANSSLGSTSGVTLDGGGLVIDSGSATGFTVDKAITLGSGGGTLTSTAATNSGTAGIVRYSGLISGTGGLTIAANGDKVNGSTGQYTALTGTNTYSGTTTITSGLVFAGNSSAFGNASNTILLNGGGLLQGGGDATLGYAIALGGSNGFVRTYGGNTLTLSGIVSGSGGLTKADGGTLVLTGSNTYTGQTTIGGEPAANAGNGTIKLGSATALGNGGGLDIIDGSLDLNGYSVSIGALSGTGAGLAATGTGSVSVITSNTAGSVTLTSNAATNTTFAGVITNGSGTVGFTKAGSGTTTFTGANTYTGPTTISAGVLQIGSGTTGALAAAGPITGSAGATLSLVGVQTIGSLSGSSAVALGANTLSVGGLNTSTTYSGAMSGAGRARGRAIGVAFTATPAEAGERERGSRRRSRAARWW